MGGVRFGTSLFHVRLDSNDSKMSSTEIVQLVGSSIGMLVAAVVGLVLFFRALNWFDHWIKQRLVTAVEHEGRSKRGKKIRRTKRSSQKEDSEYKLRPVIRPNNAPVTTVPAGVLPEPRFHVEYVNDDLGESASASTSLPMLRVEPSHNQISASPVLVSTADLPIDDRRITLQLQLLSGEVLDDVKPLTEHERSALFADLPFVRDGLTAENSVCFLTGDAQVRIVMKTAIKFIVIDGIETSHVRGEMADTSMVASKDNTRNKNNPRDGRPIRRTIP